ncbi:hypothetical protein ONZ43_g6179 [Nemania bipapillata]|uniref:Uncharacterized protein n=1 Tax=Nemania bipapillata TaxID=110536 RepID=A0ACC2I2R2_9PEZI|nr:hypothetical protein ONZ43_g6179 [Nemania bipapillata]
MSLESQSRQQKRYTRIAVRSDDDFQRLYFLMMDYIREPELALSVKEFVFRFHLPRHEVYLRVTERPEVLRAEENARDISQEHTISQFVTSLGIEEPKKSDWIRILTWMKPELVAAREEATANDPRSFEVEPFYRHRTKLFAQHAAAALLMICPNIEILKFEEGSRMVEDFLRRNNYGLLASTHLQKLRHVTLIPTTEMILGDERFYISLDILALLRLFHRLPAIESVSTGGVGPDNDGGYVRLFPPATSNLKSIHVGHSLYGADVITTLIRLPKRLEQFTLTTGGRNSLHGGYEIVSARQIGKALYQQRTWLRKIDIDIDEYVNMGGDEDYHIDDEEEEDEWYQRDMEISPGPVTVPKTREYGATIGPMHDFESLTHLSIGIRLLLGGRYYGRSDNVDTPFRLIDALPKSLEYLLIRGYERGTVEQYDSQIDELLRLKQDRLPMLAELHGIDETIPIGLSVENPDENSDELWEPESEDDDWEEEEAL